MLYYLNIILYYVILYYIILFYIIYTYIYILLYSVRAVAVHCDSGVCPHLTCLL